ncbi:hypothetical protein OEZ49_07370 [Ruegeria sp. WL0004]|uniref:Cadmium transporter n=1 Tax=Ruegeria marisflavi TaxID=2984152 RepID=A0ABT2WNW6_9RHOB|nr:hypothetical protein [Ruegeria sp. WL0004]MCU9837581.1 hypothetical protein [Ruegeria sp. WL0004]
MSALLGFAASAALAQILTNLDNLALLLALVVATGPRIAVGGYLLAQAVVLSAALAVALGLGGLPLYWIGYLGLVPLALGLRGIAAQWRGQGEAEQQVPMRRGLMATAVLFLSLSLDSFAVLTPLLADSAPAYRWAGLTGASGAALALGMGGFAAGSLRQGLGRWAARLEALAPWVMLGAGLYVLSNTGTDLV